MTESIIYKIWLVKALKYNCRKISALMNKACAEDLFFADEIKLKKYVNNSCDIKALMNKDLDFAKRVFRECGRFNINIISKEDEDYPERLKRIPDSPYVIYARGKYRQDKSTKYAALVGTRNPSGAGVEFARSAADYLIKNNCVLVSGLAVGLDSIATVYSVKNDRPSIAVSGCDIDKFFPRENTELFVKTIRNGVVISEYPPFENARYFNTRNRIISALSDVVVVAEAPKGSGAITTGLSAINYNIPLYCFVGEGDFEGSLELIQKGGKRIEKPSDIFGEIKVEKTESEGDGIEKYILDRLSDNNLSADEMVCEKYSVKEILRALCELEIYGKIESLPGGKYKSSI